MKRSETITKIAPALAKVMTEIKDITKNSSGYGYKYASLDEVLKVVRPLCAKNGISILQSQNINENGMIVVETMLLHASGEFITTEVTSPYEKLKGMNEYQSIGSSITYLRRYGLSSALGIASEEDTDAQIPQQSKQYQKTATNPQNQSKPQQQVQKSAQNPDLKQLGIEIISQGNMLIAQESIQGAIFQNKEVLKQMGFKWNAQNKSWVKPA